MSTQSEAALEKNLIAQLSSCGYEQVTIPDLDALEANFKEQLEKHNNVSLTNEEFKRILTHLDGGGTFKKALKLRDKFELHRDNETIYIEFLDCEEWCKNRFQVTNQVTNHAGRYENRYDVTILINGLPLVQVELKRRGKEIKEAFNQICRYKKDSYEKSLFAYIQIFVVSNGVNTRYFANNKSMSSKQIFAWTDEENTSVNNLSDFADSFLERCHLSKMIAKYIVLHQQDRCLMVLRPYQFYAAEAISESVDAAAQNGYIWHTTGSGKTLTSFKTAQLLAEKGTVDKVVFVVDRKDLDYQTTKEFNHFSDGSVSGSENTSSLVKHLGSEQKVIVTTIQKLTRAISAERHSKVLQCVKEKRVVFIFDECHRSQFGDMHTAITKFFTNHQCYGFTGTPIFAENASSGGLVDKDGHRQNTTKSLFGECLHKYIIQDAISDENVLGFCVEYIKTFKQNESADESDAEVEAIDTEEIFQAPERISLVTDHILSNHSRKTFDRNFTAIFAVKSIPVLIKYYEEFKKHKHDLTIATIFSFGANEDPEEYAGEEKTQSSRDMLESFMQDYNTQFGTNFSTTSGKENSFNSYYIDVARRVKEKQIDILIVVNMFLTGFDSKTLNTLYVDKNLKYHGLIQAFSRTNRLYNEQKKHGNVVCYRPIKKAVDTAVTLFSDKSPLEEVLMKSYEEHLEEFNRLIEMVKGAYPTLESIDDLQSEEDKKNFIEVFRALLRIKTRLASFVDFTFDDVKITEQEVEDYTSKYRDLYDEVVNRAEAEKVSVLDDIDFEIELLRKDNINVDYILSLLNELDPDSKSFEKDKAFIIQKINDSHELKSKKELVEAFVAKHSNLEGDVETNFAKFLEKKKQKELKALAKRENLHEDKLRAFIDEYEFSGRKDESILDEAFTESLGLLKRRTKKKGILTMLNALIDKFKM
jgi:type I restriction enzyme R subunit